MKIIANVIVTYDNAQIFDYSDGPEIDSQEWFDLEFVITKTIKSHDDLFFHLMEVITANLYGDTDYIRFISTASNMFEICEEQGFKLNNRNGKLNFMPDCADEFEQLIIEKLGISSEVRPYDADFDYNEEAVRQTLDLEQSINN